ncbi:MAG TPA: NUDIX hydrolase [Patescibacteria group bacterium]|nr:NUDIX hydrolase [Patescibacteria group bacterium]
MSWKKLDRKTVIDTKFLKVYEDKVELPNGNIIPDYSVIEKPSYSMIVALDKGNNIVTIDEYKYAIDKVIHTLPAGHIEDGEEPLESAKRELAEETGYTEGEWEYLGQFCEYPTKDLHRVHFVKATRVQKTQATNFDVNEDLQLRLISIETLKKEIQEKKWRASATLAAFVTAGLLS